MGPGFGLGGVGTPGGGGCLGSGDFFVDLLYPQLRPILITYVVPLVRVTAECFEV